MASRSHATGTLSVALVIALSSAGPAIAQAPPAAASAPTTAELQTITVVAPRITYQTRRERGSAIPKEVTIVEESALVDFRDLDLTRAADVLTLEERVGQAATRVCSAVAERVPEGQPSATICTQRAIDDAMAQVQLVTREVNRP